MILTDREVAELAVVTCGIGTPHQELDVQKVFRMHQEDLDNKARLSRSVATWKKWAASRPEGGK
jgi:hypothetical protein